MGARLTATVARQYWVAAALGLSGCGGRFNTSRRMAEFPLSSPHAPGE